MMRRIVGISAAIAIATLVVSGCSAQPAQTQEEACGVLISEVSKHTASVKQQSTGSNISDFDVQFLHDVYTGTISAVDEASSKITNEEVSKATDELSSALKEALPVVDGWVENPGKLFEDAGQYKDLDARITSATETIRGLCPDFSTVG